MSIWDDPDLQAPAELYVKLEVEGDGFTGTVKHVSKKMFDDGSVAPQLTFIDDEDGEEKTWTAGQIQAKKQLAELRPERGDRIRVRLTHVERRGTKTLKHLSVEIPSRTGGGQSTAPTSVQPTPDTYRPEPPPLYAVNGGANGNGAPAAQPAAIPPAPEGIDPEMWAAMTPEKRQHWATMLTKAGIHSDAPF